MLPELVFALTASAFPAPAPLTVEPTAPFALEEPLALEPPLGAWDAAGRQLDEVSSLFDLTDEGTLPTPEQLLLAFDPGVPVPDTPYGALIHQVAERHELSPTLIAAVVRAESAFRPRARSRKGACGLMQLMPATARRFGLLRKEIFVPEKNLNAGARYLAWLAERFAGDLPRILAAYNAGEGAVERHGGIPPYRETQGYVRRIYSYLGLTFPEPTPFDPLAPLAPDIALADQAGEATVGLDGVAKR